MILCRTYNILGQNKLVPNSSNLKNFLYKIPKSIHNNNRKIRKGMIEMPNLSQVELQNLRHFIGAHETSYQKLNTYASQVVDPQIKQMFTKAAQDSLNTKQKLMSFLNN